MVDRRARTVCSMDSQTSRETTRPSKNESSVKTVLLAKLRSNALASTREDPTSGWARAISNFRFADIAVRTTAARMTTGNGAPSAPQAVTMSRMMTSIGGSIAEPLSTDSCVETIDGSTRSTERNHTLARRALTSRYAVPSSRAFDPVARFASRALALRPSRGDTPRAARLFALGRRVVGARAEGGHGRRPGAPTRAADIVLASGAV